MRLPSNREHVDIISAMVPLFVTKLRKNILINAFLLQRRAAAIVPNLANLVYTETLNLLV
jgi:hypothetical protein